MRIEQIAIVLVHTSQDVLEVNKMDPAPRVLGQLLNHLIHLARADGLGLHSLFQATKSPTDLLCYTAIMICVNLNSLQRVFESHPSHSIHLFVYLLPSSLCQPIILLLLDISPMLPVLEGVVMELQDCALPLLNGNYLGVGQKMYTIKLP